MKRTGTPIRLQRVTHRLFLTRAVVCAACLAWPTVAAAEGSNSGWQSSRDPYRGATSSEWTSTGNRDAGQTVNRPTNVSLQTSRSASVNQQAETGARSTTAKSRWLQPTQTLSSASASTAQTEPAPPARARVGSAISKQAPHTAAAQEPKQFVPEADAKQLEAPLARRPSDKAHQSGATQAAFKSVARPPSVSALRPSANQPRPRIAASQQYRSNPGWIRPVDNPHPMSEEEIPMPYEGQTDGNYAEGPSFEPYDEGYGDAYGPGDYGPSCPCGPDCPCGPNCECGPTCGDVCCGDSIGGYCGESDCGCAVGCGDGCEPSCAYDPSCGAEPSCGCGQGDCEKCCASFDMGLGIEDPEACESVEVKLRVPKIQELSLYGGVHGFKGPYDRERDSGNFGFQEGFNIGAKVPVTKYGYQVGYQAVESQLNGDKDTNIGNPFTQQFFTAGFFKRNRNGFQFGAAWDWLHDDRWGAQDFEQLRGEASFVECGVHEFGFAGTVHLNNVRIFNDQVSFTTYQATDRYTLFYRLHGRQGGEGRVFAGLTDDADGIIGADASLPVHKYWSLNTGFTYLIPDDHGGTIGASQEAWNLGINLVWHWKGHGRKCYSNPYRPLFDVADNGSLIVDDRP